MPSSPCARVLVAEACASAPGKVILFGEHACVYGEPAVAAALDDLRVYVLVKAAVRTTTAAGTASTANGRTANADGSAQNGSSVGGTRNGTDVGNNDGDNNNGHEACGTLRIRMSDLGIDVALSLDRFREQVPQFESPPTPQCISNIRQFLSSSLPQHQQQQQPPMETVLDALTPLLYLLRQLLLSPKLPDTDSNCISNDDVSSETFAVASLDVLVSSRQLPVGAGLGSSAAFGVAAAAAIVQLRNRLIALIIQQSTSDGDVTTKHPVDDDNKGDGSSPTTSTAATAPLSPDSESKKHIDQYAYYSEVILHATPSGIDNAVSSHGGAVLYTKDGNGKVTMERFSQLAYSSTDATTGNGVGRSDPPPPRDLELLLVNSGVARSTKAQVAKVRDMRNRFPGVAHHVLAAMGAVATQFADRIRTLQRKQHSMQPQLHTRGSIDDSVVTTENHTAANDHTGDIGECWLLSLVRMNQQLLAAAGVSHPALDRICSRTDEVSNGQAAAKLTGAGGGGCALVLFAPPPINDSSGDCNSVDETSLTVKRALQRDGFRCFSSRMGGPGVLWISSKDFPPVEMTTTSRIAARTK